ncbi:MAG: AAA family ATPase [Bryobacteraceae bacterium]|nr:AAA family ATPase [Bryobacteraceae bacterium]
MPEARDLDWRGELKRQARQARLEVLGIDDVRDQAQARVGIALLKAFGDHAGGFLYFEPCTARSTQRPADAVLCHPLVGVVVVEVKGYPISMIERISGGSFYVRRKGLMRPENPFQQVRLAMFEIKNAVERASEPGEQIPLLEYFVSLPNISRSDWEAAGFHQCVEMDRLWLAEDLGNDSLRQRLMEFASGKQKLLGMNLPFTARQIELVRRAFGDSAVIQQQRPVRREVSQERLGAYIDDLLNSDKYLSAEQQELSRLEVRGQPRLIRGVAGSGKTVVLANMTARYVKRALTQQGELFQPGPAAPRVAVVCFNRALVSLIRSKIHDSYAQQTMGAIPDGVVKISHLNGLMWDLIEEGLPIHYVRIQGEDGVEEAAKRAAEYRRQLAELRAQREAALEPFLLDAMFVDEGQDFEEEEFRLLLDLIRPDRRTGEKTLIIFYDDAQNLYGRTRPVWRHVGIDVQRGDRSRVMKECFRNTRQIVEFAFNLLIGSCGPPGVRAEMKAFADLDTLRNRRLGDKPLIEEQGELVRVHFARGSWAWPRVHLFPSREQELEWVVSELRRLIVEESVRPEDILVEFHVSTEFRDLGERIRSRLPAGSIEGILQPYGRSADRDKLIFRPNHLTLSTTKGAKGYDAPVVFLVGADLFPATTEGRASFYVGATRARLLLNVSGLAHPPSLLQECTAVLSKLQAAEQGQ